MPELNPTEEERDTAHRAKKVETTIASLIKALRGEARTSERRNVIF